jgi:hypothetical protein
MGSSFEVTGGYLDARSFADLGEPGKPERRIL